MEDTRIATEPLTLPVLLAALSRALDLTEGMAVGHNVRACRIALRLGDAIGLPTPMRDDLHLGMLLKDAGCSANAAGMFEIFGGDEREAKRESKLVDWSRAAEGVRYALRHTAPHARVTERVRKLARLAAAPTPVMRRLTTLRCERGAQIARLLGLGERVAGAVYSLDEHWNGSGAPQGLRGETIPYLARLACLAQTLEVFTARFGPGRALEVARERSGTWFDPDLARVAQSLSADPAFWQELRTRPDASLEAATSDSLRRRLTERDIDTICDVFAEIVDAKSPFTAQHSRRVADYAVRIGAAMGVGGEDRTLLRRAGLLHDLGKLGVPSLILEKPGPLTGAEFARIQQHPEWTVDVLAGIPSLERVREIAAAHHEKLDGKGYGRRLTGESLDLPMRILAVADIWDALTADRPYRPGVPRERALGILWREAATGLDPDCVAAVAGLDAVVELPWAA